MEVENVHAYGGEAVVIGSEPDGRTLPPPASRVVTLADYVIVLWRYRWIILGTTALCFIAALVISKVTPKVYQSTATVLAPREGESGLLGGLAVSAVAQQLPGLPIPSFSSNRDMLISILKSETVAQSIVQQFQLEKRYEAKLLEDAVAALGRATTVAVSKEGVISIDVEDTDPQLAAAIANAYVSQLDRLASGFSTGDAGRQRKFLGEQLAQAKADLEVAENSLKTFKQHNQAIVLEEQMRADVEGAGRLKGEIIASEVELAVKRKFATESNPEVVKLSQKITEMKRHLAQMQYGDEGPRLATRRDIHVPFAQIPAVGLDLGRLTRDVKVQETLVTILAQQLEQARIAAVRDTPAVQPLDKAQPRGRPVKPRLLFNVLIASVLGLVLSTSFAFLAELVTDVRRRQGL
jgi:uncharacterized protein involved in exopolysaccharide biosynthesis